MRIVLVLAALLAAAPASARDIAFVVCDNGLRCVRAPCPAQDVVEVDSWTRHRRLSADLSQLSRADSERVASSQATYFGTLVFAGVIEPGQPPRISARRIVREASAAEAATCRKPG